MRILDYNGKIDEGGDGCPLGINKHAINRKDPRQQDVNLMGLGTDFVEVANEHRKGWVAEHLEEERTAIAASMYRFPQMYSQEISRAFTMV